MYVYSILEKLHNNMLSLNSLFVKFVISNQKKTPRNRFEGFSFPLSTSYTVKTFTYQSFVLKGFHPFNSTINIYIYCHLLRIFVRAVYLEH